MLHFWQQKVTLYLTLLCIQVLKIQGNINRELSFERAISSFDSHYITGKIFSWTAFTRFSFDCSSCMKYEPIFIFSVLKAALCILFTFSLGLLKWSQRVSCRYLTFVEVFHTFKPVAGYDVSYIWHDLQNITFIKYVLHITAYLLNI